MTIDRDDTQRFFMLGMIHRDERNPVLLRQWINDIKPGVITLEFTQYGLTFRRENRERYKKWIDEVLEKLRAGQRPYNEAAVSSLMTFIDMPDEYEIVSQYCSEQDIPFHLIDMDLFSYLKLRNAEELFNPENIERLLTGPDEHNSSSEKTMARLFFYAGIKNIPYDEEMYIRDRYMVDRLFLLMRHAPDKRFLHVTGWRHLTDPHQLYAALHPRKVFPYD